MKTVDDMYKYASSHSLPLLSNFNEPFWRDYIDNYTNYDKLFRRLYFSFRYFLQEDDEQLSNITAHFIDDVYNHLLLNEKKYSELFRINVIDDNTFSIIDNYNLTERMDKEINGINNIIEGSRTDSSTSTEGSRVDTSSMDIGSQSISETNTIAGFNSSSFSNDTKTDSLLGNRNDLKTDTKGEQNNTNSITKGEQTNTNSSNETEEYTLTRKGNIGIKTAQAILEEQKKMWSKWEFYAYIFKEISQELLLV